MHELIKSTITIGFARTLPDRLWLGVERTIYLSANTFVEPDLVVYPRGVKLEDVKGSDILLAAEVVLAGLDYDRGLKARLYARQGANEVWVIGAARRIAYLHQKPEGQVRGSIVEREPDEALTTDALPGLSVRLGSI